MPRTSDRLIVLGGTGMLGNKVVAEVVRRGYTVVAPKRSELDLAKHFQLEAFLHANTSAVALINCAGIIKARNKSAQEMTLVNSIAPFYIAQWADRHKIKVINISTDCVFSGKSGFNSVDSSPDPVDIYGRTKLLGEVACNCYVTNIRTSFIGLEDGLLAWLIANKGKQIYGWSEAYWSGASNTLLAEAILDTLDGSFRPLANIEHFSANQEISKFDLLTALNAVLKLGCEIIPIEEPRIYRTLHPTVVLPSIGQTIESIAKEYFASKT